MGRAHSLALSGLTAVFAVAVAFGFSGCKATGEKASIVIPPGDLLVYKTDEFLKFADTNYEIKLRKVTSNKGLSDVVDMTPMDPMSLNSTTEFRFIMPKNVAVEGMVVIDIVSKSNSLNWKAFVIDPSQPVILDVENTLLYDLIANYPDKDIFSYTRPQLLALQQYIHDFSKARRALFDLPADIKSIELYKFIKNGLGSDLVFLNMLKDMGTVFDFDATGVVVSSPYPFGTKNNIPLLEESRTTLPGAVGAFEMVGVNVQMDARDPDGDRLFQYFEFLEDGTMLKNSKAWTWLPSYEDSRPVPYQLRAFLSDGSMNPIELNWNIMVSDNNRAPHLETVGVCAKTVVEGETWKCKISGGNPDTAGTKKDILKFSMINPNFPEAQPYINGALYTGGYIEADEITIEWKPSNRDFLKDSTAMIMQIAVSDWDQITGKKKNGDDVMMFNLTLVGKNALPQPVANAVTGFYYTNDPVTGDPRELDTKFVSATQPYDIDTRTPNKKFAFEVVIVDSDNFPESPSQHDQISLRVNQNADKIKEYPNAASYKTLENRMINGVSRPVTVFKYSWQPTKTFPQLVASFTPIDDMQNGQGKDFTITIDAEPRSMVPVCTVNGSAAIKLSMNSTSATQGITCPAVEPATKSVQHIGLTTNTVAQNRALISQLLPQMFAVTDNKPTFFRRVINTTDFIREQALVNVTLVNHRYYFQSQTAGVMSFSRKVCSGTLAPITIPEGTQFRTRYSASPYQPRILYETAAPATLSKVDCEVVVPVRPVATNRSVAAGKLKVISPMTSGMTTVAMKVANSSAFDSNTATTASVVFTRSNTSGAITIPAGTSVRTVEENDPDTGTAVNADSVVYWLPYDVTLANGVASSGAQTVVRDLNTALGAETKRGLSYYENGLLNSNVKTGAVGPVGSTTADIAWVSPENTNLNVEALTLYPRTGFTLDKYKVNSANDLAVSYEQFDGALPKALEIDRIGAPGLENLSESAAVTAAKAVAGFSDLKVRNPLAWTDSQFGDVQFYRTAAAATDLTIPQGLVISTPDRKLYSVLEDTVIPASATTIDVSAQRFYEPTYRPPARAGTISFNWVNNGIAYSKFPSSPQIQANVETAFEIEATDNSGSPYVPKDPFDRLYVLNAKFTSTDVLNPSKVSLCREAAGPCTPCSKYNPSNPAPATIPTTITPYSDLALGSISHEASRRCFVRVSPTTADVAKLYTLNVTTCDNGGNPDIVNQSCPASDLSFYVLEPNTMPYFTALPSNLSASGSAGTPIGSTSADTLGDPTSTTLSIPTPFTETVQGTYMIYSYDPDKDANNKKVTFELLPQVYDLKTLSYVAKPNGLTIDTITNYTLNTGTGSLASARIVWTPTDAEAKRFSSAEGLILGMKVYDNTSSATTRKTQTAYYKVKVANVNQTPFFGSIGASSNNNSYTILADTYFNQTFNVYDNDFTTPSGGTFKTLLGACWNADGSRNANAYFDASSTDDAVCHLTGPEWGSDSYDPTSNAGPNQCKVGGVASGALNTDLVVPKITRTANTFTMNGTSNLYYTFKIEWCPQKIHIGTYAIGIKAFDNGDTDVQGSVAARKGGSTPLNLKVIAPVYLTSPTPTKTIRQTAADITSNPFTYQVIAKNPKGNKTTYSIVSGPAGGDLKIDINTGFLSWTPKRTDITSGAVGTNKTIVVKALDTVTNESATGTISVWVQDPLAYPGEQTPSLVSTTPAAGVSPSVRELGSYPFTIVASDPNIDNAVNHDQLFARIYVDNKIFNDVEMTRVGTTNNWTTTFNYKPVAGDGSVDLDGAGPLTRGQHYVAIEVTDGNFQVSRQWTVNVRNTTPVPTLAFDTKAVRQGMEGSSTTWANWGWHQDVAGSTTLSGNLYESLYFAGTYRRNNVVKYFLWSLDFVNDVLTKTGQGSNWNFYDNLNWGASTVRLSYSTDLSSNINNIYLTNQSNKFNSAWSTSTGLKLGGDLSTLPATGLTSVYACGSCATPLYYSNTDAQGNFLVAKFAGTRSFYSTGTSLYWDKTGATSGTQITTWPTGYTITGMAVNEKTKRLFVAGSKSTATENRVLIYDIAPTVLATPGNPVLIANLDVSATASWSVQGASIPADIAIDSTNTAGRTSYKVAVFLKGLGGLVVINDDGATPAFSTVGVGSLPSSASDSVATGRKLIYDAKNDQFLGVSREARVVYTVDAQTLEAVQKPTATAIDGLWVLPSGTTFLVDRANLYLYRGL
jgi:large repetitive protein